MCIENYGGRSSVGRAPDCDSGRRGFEPHRHPNFFLVNQSNLMSYTSEVIVLS